MQLKRPKINLSKLLTKFLKHLQKIEYKKFLVSTYFQLIVAGFTLTGLAYTFMPFLRICSSLFGVDDCDPVGNYIVTFASFPGYIVTSVILFFYSNTPSYLIISSIVLFSLLIYFLIGLAIDNFKSSDKPINKIQTLIIAVFAILVISLLLLV
jgi:hypothetical protein